MMDKQTQAFWLERWDAQEIGFHLDFAHPWLVENHARLGLAKGEQVLVPLAGKSQDLIFLRDCGYQVLAVEISERALIDFAKENQLEVLSEKTFDWGKVVKFEGIDFVVADWFAVPPSCFSQVKAVYDRAALIALAESDRGRYVQYLRQVLPGPLNLLLITLDYEQVKMSGPPYSVTESMVKSLYQDFAVSLDVLKRKDIIDEEPRFKAKGLDFLNSTLYLLKP